ncbi:hypothetical protein NDU88_004943 [Pleurodeles waltl]|uniref:Uncharacterized protein n=1 Tax=Pleurodeles waltl TaxID=8319 RepID=A0AAV7SKA7_PLEWA|nr:hypothetical protein NDU88_004943 [Pleurodeles waltl]
MQASCVTPLKQTPLLCEESSSRRAGRETENRPLDRCAIRNEIHQNRTSMRSIVKRVTFCAPDVVAPWG